MGVNQNGELNLEELRKALSENTALVSLMSANNETGVTLPIQKAGEIVKEQGIFFHVDAVQSIGKSPFDLAKSGVIDFLSASGHKFYGPKGIGILYIKKQTAFQPLVFGGVQERSRRAGTENVSGIVGMGAASQLVRSDLSLEMTRLAKLRDEFENQVGKTIPAVLINGKSVERLVNTSDLYFENVEGEALLFALDQKGICASSGSACLTGAREPSRVLKAMGCSGAEANSSLRFSFGRYTTFEEIQEAVQILAETVSRLRAMNSERLPQSQE